MKKLIIRSGAEIDATSSICQRYLAKADIDVPVYLPGPVEFGYAVA